MLTGSIAGLGSHYVITLDAVNVRSGDSIGREQVEAESKEKVLTALGQASTRLRAKLGESMGSIQAYDAPIERATTSSLEALKAFSVGEELRSTKGEVEAIPHFERALELDPNFAMAYAKLGALYGNIGETERSFEYGRKAFERRDRVSEREKLYISAALLRAATPATPRRRRRSSRSGSAPIRATRSPTTTRASSTPTSASTSRLSPSTARRSRSSPTSAFAYTNLAYAYVYMNRLEEAKTVTDQAFQRKLDKSDIHFLLYQIAFLQGDNDGMRRELEWAKGRPDESLFRWAEARALRFARPAAAGPRALRAGGGDGRACRVQGAGGGSSCWTRHWRPPCAARPRGPARMCGPRSRRAAAASIRWARPMPSPWPASRTRHGRFSRKWPGNSPSRP